jgi:hypothetical protein
MEVSMWPESIKTTGYLISCVSVALLGVAAYPGAEKAGLAPALFAGMATSVIGMALRWLSYEVEKRRKHASGPKANDPPVARSGSAADYRCCRGG